MSDIKFEKCNDKDINDRCEVISAMADEIAELREALSSMIEHFDKYNGNIENISNLSYSALKSKQLLNK